MPKNGKWVYIAAPYTIPDPVENTHKAIEMANKLILEGIFPIVPHLTLLWHAVTPFSSKFWYDYTLELMKRCDAVLRIPGESAGADLEIKTAQKLGMPVYYSVEELLNE